MIIHDCVQGTKRWRQLRLGIPTASEFGKIVTPNGKLSKQSVGYMNELLAEAMLGHEIESFQSKWMERGNEYEGEAVKAYEFDYERETERVGFITNDAGTIGASPDRRIGTVGGLEVKCPLAHTQIARLLSGMIDDAYNPQLQGQLYVCDSFEWMDNLYYHPELPRSIIRVPRDEPYIKILHDSLSAFTDQMAAKRADLEKRFGPFPKIELDEPETHGGLGITDEDLNDIILDIASRDGFTNPAVLGNHLGEWGRT